ncbi:MAG: hypothetical protein QNJ47_25370 [Nostocaceae cyanobacterium]|nr:hypothetical protein [Nostocaceae cyanobacterium]
MRYIFFSLLLPFYVAAVASSALAKETQWQSSPLQRLSSREKENFYTRASRLVQQHINLIARIERAISHPDANQVRVVRGQLTVYTKTVDNFLKRHSPQQKAGCTRTATVSSLRSQLTAKEAQIYCSLYATNQELLKLAPTLDVLLSRRGELGLVRKLPLVSGEMQSHPVLSIASVQRPNLGKKATPFATQEPNLPVTTYQPSPRRYAYNGRKSFTAQPDSTSLPATTTLQIIGRTAKKPLANYQPPMQPAIVPPQGAIATLQTSRQLLAKAVTAFPSGTKFQDPRETAAALDRFAYDIDPREAQTYARVLDLPNTGIFRVLPHWAYYRPLNKVENRLQKSVSERYPFPTLGESVGSFTPSLALQIVDNKFQILPSGIDYSFMVNVGDIPIEKLDSSLKAVSGETRQFFLNYQPPKQLEALQVERRRLITGKNQNWNYTQVLFDSAKAKLNHTYLVRTLQFQLPEIIMNNRYISRGERLYLDKLLEMQSSDTILAFRPVRRRDDGTYTVIWRILKQLPNPQIEDLEKYVKLSS